MAGERPRSERPPGERPPGERPPGDRPPGNRPPGERPPDERPPGERPPDPDSQRYARYWEPVLAAPAMRLLDRLGRVPVSFLDLGAGTGSLTLAAAGRWPSARIVALDASPAMLGLARQRAAAAGHDERRIDWLTADAAAIPLEAGTVEAVASSFVLQLVEDRSAVLREILRVLAPGGTFAFVTWLDAELELPADAVFLEMLEELGLDDDDAAEAPTTPRPQDYASPEEARAELLAAGFEDVDVGLDELRYAWTAPAYLEWKERFDERDSFEALTPADRARLREALGRRLGSLPASAFELVGSLAVGVGRRPSTR